jgi:hypothetical protein
MLPLLSPLNDGDLTGAVVAVPPPPGFRPALAVERAAYGNRFPFPNGGHSGSQKAGLRYEKAAAKYLKETFANTLIGRAVHFRDALGSRVCVPDAIIHCPQFVIVVEIKLQHMPEAWWQLRKLYEPVLKHIYGSRVVACVEMVKHYDSGMPFPEAVNVIDDLHDVNPDKFGVFRWTP